MIVRLTQEGTPHLEEAADFTGFRALAPRGADLESLVRNCGPVDADGAHLWVEPEWLRGQGADEAAWRESFAGMIGHAGCKGWLHASGRIRAHIEIED